jgi:dephospho-CoA kinase
VTDPKMIPLGFGKYVRADRIFAIEPIREERGSGARTRVWIEGIADPLVASRSERAILADLDVALAESAGVPRSRRRSAAANQGELPV